MNNKKDFEKKLKIYYYKIKGTKNANYNTTSNTDR